MSVSEDTTERPVQAPTTASSASASLGSTMQAMKDAVNHPSRFERFADWVSEAMGRPFNIAFWFVVVVAWTLVFALGGQHLSSGTWLPAWFTSQGYNFPLNLVTTVAELFIGFLVATAANRAQNALTALLDKIDRQEEQIAATELNIVSLLQENTLLTSEIHALTTEMAKNSSLIIDVHRHVAALSAQAGIVLGDPPPALPAPETASAADGATDG